MTRNDGAGIGVSLSGGGIRAALFTLGVSLYLVHSGLNRQVKVITSVSGVSITNAIIASAGDFANADRTEFDSLCARLAHALARKGSFFLPKRFLVQLGILALIAWAGILWTSAGRSPSFRI